MQLKPQAGWKANSPFSLGTAVPVMQPQGSGPLICRALGLETFPASFTPDSNIDPNQIGRMASPPPYPCLYLPPYLHPDFLRRPPSATAGQRHGFLWPQAFTTPAQIKSHEISASYGTQVFVAFPSFWLLP
jgi:hypothetical protein